MAEKTLLFGLDGGTLKIVERMVRDGRLPAFKELMDSGVYGELESTIPPITMPAWASMFTGLNPGNLGIVDRFSLDENYKQDLEKPTWKGQYFWDFLGEEDYRTGIVNPPSVRKIYKINGFMLSGFSEKSEVYPRTFDVDLEEIPPYKAKRTSKIVETLMENLEKKRRTVSSLLEKDWDHLTFVLKETDSITHFVDDWERVEEVYERADDLLREIMGESDDCNILIASDHGIKRIRRRVFVNALLEKMGFLEESGEVSKNLLSKLEGFVRRTFGSSVIKTLANSLPFIKAQQVRESMGLERIDKGKTKIFGYGARAADYPRLWINTEERFEKGIVEESEIESVKSDFVKKLEELEDGENPIEEVFDAPEVYAGREARWIPDLVAKLEDDCIEDYKVASRIEDADEGFGHSRQGIFMAYGPDIKGGGKELENLGIYDIAPTILHTHGLSIPKNIDGRVLGEIFAGDTEPARREVRYREPEVKMKIKNKVRRLRSEGKI